MNPTPQVQKPKVDNHGMFLQLLKDHPPQYKIGDKVRYYFKNGSVAFVGIVNCYVFNEREKNWKYTVKDLCCNCSYDDIVIFEKYNEHSRTRNDSEEIS